MKRIDEVQDGIALLLVSFVLEERIDGRVLGSVFPQLMVRRYAGKWDYA